MGNTSSKLVARQGGPGKLQVHSMIPPQGKKSVKLSKKTFDVHTHIILLQAC